MSEAQVNTAVFDEESMYIGPVYAKALLAAVGPSGDADGLMTQFKSFIQDVLDKQPALEAALANPKISAEEKIRILDKVFAGKMDPTLLTFLKVLSKRGRLNVLRGIYEQCRKATVHRDVIQLDVLRSVNFDQGAAGRPPQHQILDFHMLHVGEPQHGLAKTGCDNERQLAGILLAAIRPLSQPRQPVVGQTDVNAAAFAIEP